MCIEVVVVLFLMVNPNRSYPSIFQERLLLLELQSADPGVSSSYVCFPRVCIAKMVEKEINQNLKACIY